MKVPQTAIFRQQRERFVLRFTCEHCALFERGTKTCAHGYPTREHRLRYYEDPTVPIVFCKDFDLE
ncbi:MAG: hypothetical protein OXU20_10860 [Myxococcales bacterium]|nr:hypothetical protein [Myxococcales bacterium]MDD9967288.1 hypothetical protein [Myxococcales bacterium]